jgi:hypothetical protein
MISRMGTFLGFLAFTAVGVTVFKAVFLSGRGKRR